ncbi:hypothetical protein WMO13_03955 [Ignatzschineria larvae DSM 13226]|uniref:Uncharacterized protein n=1 Tax=Ignatzschineria larvae DSM 13226 TaxID=1111732 RepID=A0ABZ3C173_9GAMM|nr:hypothetical protein [Ignatzschineria larvae]
MFKSYRPYLIALLLVLLLHGGIGYLLLKDEKTRVDTYLTEAETIQVSFLPAQFEETQAVEESIEEPIDKTLEMDSTLPEEASEDQPSDETDEEMTEASPEAIEEEDSEEIAENEDSDDQEEAEETSEESGEEPAETEEESEPQAPSYRQNLTESANMIRDNILPPRKEGEYRRTITTEEDPYQKMVENAVALLADTPFLDKEWKDAPADEETPTYYSPEFFEYLQKYNPAEPEQPEVVEEEIAEAEASPEEAIIDKEAQFTNDQPVTLIATFIDPPIDEAILEQEAKQKEETKARAMSTNILNAATNQLRRQEYNISLASNECYERYIKGKNFPITVAVMIFESPLRVGVYRSSGNDALDQCVVNMVQQVVQVPSEMERIREYAPRLGKSYLLNASFNGR